MWNILHWQRQWLIAAKASIAWLWECVDHGSHQFVGGGMAYMARMVHEPATPLETLNPPCLDPGDATGGMALC